LKIEKVRGTSILYDFLKTFLKLYFLPAGVKARVRQIRNGIEMKPLMQDNHYDFNYQSTGLFAQPVRILPVRIKTFLLTIVDQKC
jgi:hypothetical protein